MSQESLYQSDRFKNRHVGPRNRDVEAMLHRLDLQSLDQLIEKVIPKEIRSETVIDLGGELTELELQSALEKIAKKNKVYRSWLGMGYANCVLPAVIRRNILENPGWYTQYTPYQAEISQGRLEALLIFQTMIVEMTGLPVANASLLDEATAAAEAMNLAFNEFQRDPQRIFFVSEDCHPQTIDVVKGRANGLGIELLIGDHRKFREFHKACGVLLQYPSTRGVVDDFGSFVKKSKEGGALVIMACDLLSLALLKSPGELGVDIAVGNSQRFGVPLGYGGPHAAFFASSDALKRKVPGRIVGISKDVNGKGALRLSLQTREQHIRREKATSNICTAQALLANMAAMYAVYHGPDGIKNIAEKVHFHTCLLWQGAKECALDVGDEPFFDTVLVRYPTARADSILKRGWDRQINLRKVDDKTITVSFDETTGVEDVRAVLELIAERDGPVALSNKASLSKIPSALRREMPFLTRQVFNRYHSETEMMRFLKRLENKDLSLTYGMIPLGSCTMKLNAAVELFPISWPEFANVHPFVPFEQAEGYQILVNDLSKILAKLTGFSSVSLQPNSGAQGEYAGLVAIRGYQRARGESGRDICLIPSSAHGTNPASAAMAGLKVIVVRCDSSGNIDLEDLTEKARLHRDRLSVLMLTYPSTHGVFEAHVRDVCEIVHLNGGQVYLDGANFNAQVGFCFPGEYGSDVCHLNLHKTFAIPHGGGGPGVGPIAVKEHLIPFLPGHGLLSEQRRERAHAVSAAPYGNAGILPISWAYIRMMGWNGLRKATQVAILNANYIAARLKGSYEILYKGVGGFVAHECIVDVRNLKKTSGVDVFDIAKRLMDYGFHAPTVSFPVPGTLMVEPTESESLEELDRFCDALIAIRKEIRDIEDGKADRSDNVLKNAPHTMDVVTASQWDHPYSRELAAFPTDWVRGNKFWPSSSRIDEAYGDRHFNCLCS